VIAKSRVGLARELIDRQQGGKFLKIFNIKEARECHIVDE